MMAVLTTTTGQHVLTPDEPYTIARLANRYYFIAEFVTDTNAVKICIYDAVADTELVTLRTVSEADASTIWQSWYGALSA
jgi:hypothetical protein